MGRSPATGRGWAGLHLLAVDVLTHAARAGLSTAVEDKAAPRSAGDVAEFVSLAVAGAAANVGGIGQLLGGRAGSWEADHLRHLLASTVGWNEADVLRHRTEPLVIVVEVDRTVTDLGVWATYDASEREINRLEDAVGVVYDVCDSGGTWTPSDSQAAPLPADVTTSLQHLAKEGARAYREPTDPQVVELQQLDEMREQLDRLRARDWAEYGEAFRASIQIELNREAIAGLEVPVDVRIDISDPGAATGSLGDGFLPAPIVRLLETDRQNPPLPGAGLAPKNNPPSADIAAIELAERRLPHRRLPREEGGSRS